MGHLSTKFLTKGLLLSSIVVTTMMMSGCGQKEAEAVTLNIGFQKYGLLPVIKERGALDTALKNKNINVRWIEFPAGPQLLEGLNVGSVALGEVGEAPPIFAQAAGANLVYIANQPAAPSAEALIVPKDSQIQKVTDLKGKCVALNKGSNVHYLLVKLLEANNLKLSDIEVVYLPPADARAAFERGAVDAWVIWDPFYAAAQQQIGARLIANGDNLVKNYQFYMVDRKFAEQHPEVIQDVITELNNAADWVKNNQKQAAQILEKLTGLAESILQTSISRMSFGVQPISTSVAKEQQYVADAFYQEKLIPKQIDIQSAILKSTTQK